MKVKVWNDNVYPFEQEYKGKRYKIESKKYIEMDQEEASQLLKSYSPIKVDHGNMPLPQSYKMLRVDQGDLDKIKRMAEARTKAGSYMCQACGYIANSKWELSGHIQDMHQDQWEDPEEALKEVVKQNKARKKA